MLMPAQALQRDHLFARHFHISSAASAVRDLGSGGDACSVPELNDGPYTSCTMCTLVPDLSSLPAGIHRFGEARNPGPHQEDLLTVGVSNPCGLRRKEDVLLGLGPGIWSLAETHLSQQTFRTCSGILRKGAQQLNRQVRFHGGAPAPLRQGSTWAGTWTGVAVLSDHATTPLNIPWPAEQWESGRVLLTRHWVAATPITVGTFYGYARGPTWPRARQLSDQLLENFTTEVILGMSGVRLIMGDFNQEAGQLVQQQIWLRHGWRNAQQLAEEMLNHNPVPTCKGATSPDQIWLSPEAIHLLRGLQVTEDFLDHSTLAVALHIPPKPVQVFRWPRPAKIPWQSFSLHGWEPVCPVDFVPGEDPTTFMQRWAQSFEQSVCQQAVSANGTVLPKQCGGRAQRLLPAKQPLASPTCKASREGEVELLNTMVGTATRIWFRQLRRLQSLKHAVQAGKQTPAAVAYRCELWIAIKKATGFTPNFPIWWQQQQHMVEGTPQVLPTHVPCEPIIVMAIYESFHSHFRAFESWHLRQRTSSLRTKYAGNLEALFQDLRNEPKQGVEILWKDTSYTVLAVDTDEHKIHLDNVVHPLVDSVWIHNDHMINITGFTADLCTVSDTAGVLPGDELLQRSFVTDTNDVLHVFSEHWRSRWCAMAEVSSEDWTRIVQFTCAFMPRHDFTWQPLNAKQWQQITKRIKRKAARGPDGFDKMDLINMPTSFVEVFLKMMNDIELGDTNWPQQMMFGTVIGLPKVDDAHKEDQFRPITLFSILYRTWARLRTKQLLQQLALLVPSEALGFLPKREAAEVWLNLQATIELMMQHGHSFAGLSTDLKRAFNNIGRAQVFQVAQHVGLPQPLLLAWNKFLGSFVRRFDILGNLGDEIVSGFPEGCPLSIVAMLMVNWSFHVYMKAFCPAVSSYSFVDNLTLAAREAALVAQAYFALRTICLLFGLQTDDEKTYVWGLTAEGRCVLLQLGFPCVTDASELGGAMTYGRGRRTRVLRARGEQLRPKWDKLRKSFAPQLQKYSVLPKVFWPKALHGSPNCLIADSYAMELRRAAVKALGANGAGSNPLLRLTLSDDMMNDPGFYQLVHCLYTFKRMLRKTPDLLVMWKIWMRNYDGKLLPGPFSRLLHCFSCIGWMVVDPPFVTDHNGRTWNLYMVDHKTLMNVLRDAWLQFVAGQVKHKTMHGLQGLDEHLTLLDAKSMSPLDRARLSALHSGAFITAYEHSKYDATKTPMCTTCATEDDRAHWLQCPRFASLRSSIPGWLPDNVELPCCMIHHLLVPRLPRVVQLQQLLYDLAQDPITFCLVPPRNGFHHLFIDGSCTVEQHQVLQIASWAVVNATLGLPVAHGPLAGLTQSIDRAELTALLMALSWADGTELDLCIWSDSQSTVDVASYLLLHDCIPDGVANYDLWYDIHMALQAREGNFTRIRWTPSHIPPDMAEDTFEDWVILWNDLADRLAVQTNTHRPPEFMAQLQSLRSQLDQWSERVRQLRRFYFLVADSNQHDGGHQGEEIQTLSSEDDDEMLLLSFSEHLPVNWHVQCLHGDFLVPGAFLVGVINWFCAVESFPGTTRHFSELELVFALALDSEFCFPFQLDGTLGFAMRQPRTLFQRPTLAQLLRPVQKALKGISSLFPHLISRTPPEPAEQLGVYMRFPGIRFKCPDTIWRESRSYLLRHTSSRPIRLARDLARPLL